MDSGAFTPVYGESMDTTEMGSFFSGLRSTKRFDAFDFREAIDGPRPPTVVPGVSGLVEDVA